MRKHQKAVVMLAFGAYKRIGMAHEPILKYCLKEKQQNIRKAG